MLQHYDHVVTAFAHGVSILVLDFGGKAIVGEVIREMSRVDSSDLARDTSGTRQFSLFLVELAQKIPDVVLTSMSILVPFLDQEVRNVPRLVYYIQNS